MTLRAETRRRPRWLAAVICAAAVTVAAPALADAQTPPRDSVTGEALIGEFPDEEYLGISAGSGPNGEDPQGGVSLAIWSCLTGPCGTNSWEFGGEVTCLNVRGNRAIIGYYGFTEIHRSPMPWTYRGFVEVVDTGPASALRDSVEILEDADLHPDYPDHIPKPFTVCPSSLPSPGVRYDPLAAAPTPDDPNYRRDVAQDFTVIDAHRLPTSKEQCKKGGWQSFGVFKNQGDCVSFVATGGKNRPGKKP